MSKEQPINETAEALHFVAKAIRLLGKGNIERQETEPGALEELTDAVKESGESISGGLHAIADSITQLAESVSASNQQD